MSFISPAFKCWHLNSSSKRWNRFTHKLVLSSWAKLIYNYRKCVKNGQSLVIAKLDYCISLLAGLPWARSFLQLNQNSATWLALTLPKISHMTKLLCYLHWLPAASLRFIYNTKHGPPPSWRHLSNPVLHLFPPSKPQVQLDWPEYQCLALTWWYT